MFFSTRTLLRTAAVRGQMRAMTAIKTVRTMAAVSLIRGPAPAGEAAKNMATLRPFNYTALSPRVYEPRVLRQIAYVGRVNILS